MFTTMTLKAFDVWFPHLNDFQKQELLYTAVPGLREYDNTTEFMFTMFKILEQELKLA